MKTTYAAVARFVADEEAATAAEYGIIAALVGTALVAGLGYFSTGLQNVFKQISNKLVLAG